MSLTRNLRTTLDLGKSKLPTITNWIKSLSMTTSKTHKSTLFFFHGLGDCGASWQYSLNDLVPKHVQVKCPTAPSQPVTINGGASCNSWFDIKSMAFDATTLEDEDGIKDAAKKVHELIKNEQKDSGLSSENIMLGGFSQGGALALYSTLTYPEKLAGVIALSCWLPLHKTFPAALASANKDLHILQCHGDLDFVVLLNFGKATYDELTKIVNKDNINFIVYENMGHQSFEPEMEEVKKFIESHLPPSDK